MSITACVPLEKEDAEEALRHVFATVTEDRKVQEGKKRVRL
jgi:hypothetical protein